MKIAFCDFWDQFNQNNNFFKDVFTKVFSNVQVVNQAANPDILIYSCFGHQHHYTNRTITKKIYYTGENHRPNFNDCDLSLTFDFETYSGKNFRLPLWMLQIDWFNKGGYINPEFVLPYDQIASNAFINNSKTKFCVAVFNTDSPHRFDTVRKLSNYKKVDCYGKPHGNWFYGESDKYKVISNYKFSICYENTIYPGYYTEKLFHAKCGGTVPLYWADPNIVKDFNKKSFINLHDFNSNVEALIKYVKFVDQTPEVYEQYKAEPLFNVMPTLNSLEEFLRKNIKVY
jgi:hypothetical protein